MSEQPQPLTPEERQQIRERESKATPGPWTVDKFEDPDGPSYCHVDGWTDTGEEWLNLHGDDATFIAYARSDIPRLLATIDALEAQLAEYRECAEFWHAFQARVAAVRQTLTYPSQGHALRLKWAEEAEELRYALLAPYEPEEVTEEGGDCLVLLAAIAEASGTSLEAMAEAALAKLRGRVEAQEDTG